MHVWVVNLSKHSLEFRSTLERCTFFWVCVSMDVVAMATVNGKGNYSQRQNPHTSGRIQRPWKIMFVCIRSSIIQCVQLKSHAIYLIFRYFAQITMNTNRVRAHFVFQYARSVFFFKYILFRSHYMRLHKNHPQIYIHKSTKSWCVTSLFCTLFDATDLLSLL